MSLVLLPLRLKVNDAGDCGRWCRTAGGVARLIGQGLVTVLIRKRYQWSRTHDWPSTALFRHRVKRSQSSGAFFLCDLWIIETQYEKRTSLGEITSYRYQWKLLKGKHQLPFVVYRESIMCIFHYYERSRPTNPKLIPPTFFSYWYQWILQYKGEGHLFLRF